MAGENIAQAVAVNSLHNCGGAFEPFHLQVFLSRGRLKAGGGIMDAGIIKHAAAAGLKTGYLGCPRVCSQFISWQSFGSKTRKYFMAESE